jgi:hypothetical protein
MANGKKLQTLEMSTRSTASGDWKKRQAVYFLPAAGNRIEAEAVIEKLRTVYPFPPEWVRFYFNGEPL